MSDPLAQPFRPASKRPWETAQALTKLSEQYCKARDFKKAVRCALRAIEKNPEYAPAWYAQAIALEGLGAWKSAWITVQVAIEMGCDHAEVSALRERLRIQLRAA